MNALSAFKKHQSDLEFCLSAPIHEIFQRAVQMGGTYHGDMTKRTNYAHINNGSPVLAVAHVDTVQRAWHKKPTYHWLKEKRGKMTPVVKHPNLDDRLGVFTILYLLPALGINVDVLLADYEEQGMSTAEHFRTDKDYNWMVEFDRTGDDVVLYDYRYNDHGHGWQDAIRDAGFDIGFGSFSDISCLTGLGVCGFNVGVGYYDYHSKNAWADLTMYCEQLDKYVQFHNTNATTNFEWADSYKHSYHSARGYTWDDAYNEYNNWQPTHTYWDGKKWTTRSSHTKDYRCYMCDLNLGGSPEFLGMEKVEKGSHVTRHLCGWCAKDFYTLFTIVMAYDGQAYEYAFIRQDEIDRLTGLPKWGAKPKITEAEVQMYLEQGMVEEEDDDETV